MKGYKYCPHMVYGIMVVIFQVKVHRWYIVLTSIHIADGQLLTDDR